MSLIPAQQVDDDKDAQLPSLVTALRCPGCGRPAVRFFEQANDLKTLEVNKGSEALLDKVREGLRHDLKTVRLPTMTVSSINSHSEPMGFDIGAKRDYNGCNHSFTVTTNPRKVAWDFFSNLRMIRAACKLNGVTMQRVQNWWESLDDNQALNMMISVIQFTPVPDPDNRLQGGPYYVVWYDSSKIHTHTPDFTAASVNADDACDNIGAMTMTEKSVSRIEFSVNASLGDYAIDVPQSMLERTYSGQAASICYVQPVNAKKLALQLSTGLYREALFTHPLASPFYHIVPKDFFLIPEDRQVANWKPDKASPFNAAYHIITGQRIN